MTEADYPVMEQEYDGRFLEIVQVGDEGRWYQEWGFTEMEFEESNANVLVDPEFRCYELDKGFLPSERGSVWYDKIPEILDIPEIPDESPIKLEIVEVEKEEESYDEKGK